VKRCLVVACVLTGCGRFGFDDTPAHDAAIGRCVTWSAFDAPQRLSTISTIYNDWSPAVTADGGQLAYSHWDGAVGQYDVAVATGDAGVFATPGTVIAGLDSDDRWEVEPSFTADGAGIVFATMVDDVWGIGYAPRTGATTVGTARILVATTGNYNHEPELSADGLRLYYTSNNYPPTNGNLQIVVATRTSINADFGDPQVIESLDTENNEESQTMSSDEREVIFSREIDGDYDLYRATRDDRDGPFSAPQRIDELSTMRDDIGSMLSLDGTTLYYNRDTVSGGADNADLWVATRTCLAR
jgi:Tol biopolymer transport system component